MGNNFHEDQVLGKAYDSKLMKRLLKYAKPYWHLLALTIVLMMVVTGLELVRPYLIKITIDDYINGYRKPMYEVELSEPYEGTIYNGKKYVRIDRLSESEKETLKNNPIKDFS